MYFADIAEVAIFGLVGLVVVMLLGWLLAFFVSVFFRILGIEITGEAFLSCLSTVLAATVTGACGVITAIISTIELSAPVPEISGGPVPPSVESPNLAPFIIVGLIIVFVVAFLVVRRTLRKSVT